MEPDARDAFLAWPGPVMGAPAYRAMFAVFVDVLFAATREQRHAVIDCMGGLTSGHFILAIADGRLRVDVRLEESGTPVLWVSFRSDDGYQPVLACLPHVIGADAGLLLREQEMRLEDALEAILGGEEA